MGCQRSQDCGAGWTCVDGLCQFINTNNTGGLDGCGGNLPNSCPSCGQPGCGSNCTPSYPVDSCNRWCDEQYKSLGEETLRLGCRKDDVCETCKTCRASDCDEDNENCGGPDKCQDFLEKTGNCNCDKDCDDCEECEDDEGSLFYGECMGTKDCEHCCYQEFNCCENSEGETVGPFFVQICSPVKGGVEDYYQNKCLAYQKEFCADKCDVECMFNDECPGCSLCVNGECSTSAECDDPCPEGTFQTPPYRQYRLMNGLGVPIAMDNIRSTSQEPVLIATNPPFLTAWFTTPCGANGAVGTICTADDGCYFEDLGENQDTCCSCKNETSFGECQDIGI